MIYLFDECLSDKLVNLLRLIGCDDIWHITKYFSKGAKDPVFLSKIRLINGVLVTNDTSMLTEHAAILAQEEIDALFLHSKWSEIGKRKQALYLLNYWPKIHQQVLNRSPVGLNKLSLTGKLLPVKTNYKIKTR